MERGLGSGCGTGGRVVRGGGGEGAGGGLWYWGSCGEGRVERGLGAGCGTED